MTTIANEPRTDLPDGSAPPRVDDVEILQTPTATLAAPKTRYCVACQQRRERRAAK